MADPWCCRCIPPRCRTATERSHCCEPRIAAFPFVKRAFADAAYAGRFTDATCIAIEIVRKQPSDPSS